MKTFLLGFGGALSTIVLLGTAAASAAPEGPGSAADTVASLEAQGFKVLVNKVGHLPLDQCTVRGVRQGQEVTELKRNKRDQTVERVKYTTVYVDATC